MAKKYDALIDQVVDLVGSKDNITVFTHCITRLRFNLKDKELVQFDEVQKLGGVVGAQWSGEQLQLIIGQDVGDVYKEICKKHQFAMEKSIDENLDQDKKFNIKALPMNILDGLSGSLTPLIPVLTGAGMLKIICMVISLLGVVAEDNNTYLLISHLADAIFYFLPVLVGFTSARKFGASECLGMGIGALLISPNFINMVAAGNPITIFGLPVYAGSYSSTIIPTILSVFILSRVEKFLRKVSPTILKAVLVPTLSLLIMLPITLVVTGPLGFYLGTYVSGAVIWLYDTLGVVGLAILTGFKPLLTMTGMHLSLAPYMVQTFSSLGYEAFYLPASVLANLNQGAASLAVGLKSKNADTKATAISCAATALIAGVTEPAMFGVTLKYKKPMVGAIIGGIVCGAVAGILKVTAYAFPGSVGVLGSIIFIGPNNNLLKFILTAVIGFVVTFIATWILGFEEDN